MCSDGNREDDAAVVIAGAGIAGVATAFHLSVGLGIREIMICDPLPPLTLTSDKSTECYRNWWPGPGDAMVGLMNRSIDLLEDWSVTSRDVFHLSRRGYLYVTADMAQLNAMTTQAQQISMLGGGELRTYHGSAHDPRYVASPLKGYANVPSGADLFVDSHTLRTHFPYLSTEVIGGLHARRAGWFSAQQLGIWLLEQARAAGAKLIHARVSEVEVEDGRVCGVVLQSGRRIATSRFVNAAGPHVGEVARMVGREIPVFSEVHRKIAFPDTHSALPRNAPMLIWNDPQTLRWGAEERAALDSDSELSYLVDRLPPGAHCRPEGSDEANSVLGLWEYHTEVRQPEFPIPGDFLYPEIVLRGLSTMVPAFSGYLDHLPNAYVDGGYYTKTQENRPLIGPLGPHGSFVVGALSGFGVMAAAAAGELAALHVTGVTLPEYAPWFSPDRYSDPEYLTQFSQMTETGQI